MKDAVIQLFGSRKFLVMLFTQLAIVVPAVFKIIPTDLAVEAGVALVGAWMAAHAHEEKGKQIEAGEVVK